MRVHRATQKHILQQEILEKYKLTYIIRKCKNMARLSGKYSLRQCQNCIMLWAILAQKAGKWAENGVKYASRGVILAGT